MNKTDRRKKILQLIAENKIDTQTELAIKLNELGYKVTQATVSRDIREMNLNKVRDKDSKTYYIQNKEYVQNLDNKFISIFKNSVVDVELAQNLVIIKTLAGTAMAVASAIDAFELEGVAGCIAGDDTIFVATYNNNEALKVRDKLYEYRM